MISVDNLIELKLNNNKLGINKIESLKNLLKLKRLHINKIKLSQNS